MIQKNPKPVVTDVPGTIDITHVYMDYGWTTSPQTVHRLCQTSIVCTGHSAIFNFIFMSLIKQR